MQGNAIVFCGNIIVDQIKMIPRWPDKGMLVPISSVRRAVGGSVCNTAIDLKTLDPSVAVKAVGKVGADEKKAMALLASAQTSGALVTRVWAGSPAAKAGLAVGDILLNARLAKSHRTRDLEDSGSGDEFDWGAFFSMSIGGEDEDYGGYYEGVSPWPNVERGVNRTFTSFGIGKKVVVSYVRDGARKEVEMTLEQAPVHDQTAKRIKNKDLGIIVSDMTFEVRGYFKFAEDAPGVVIVKVQPGNPAAIGGLRPLEIITHVNNEPVTGAKDFARKVKGKKDLTFAVRRLAATRVVRIDLKQP